MVIIKRSQPNNDHKDSIEWVGINIWEMSNQSNQFDLRNLATTHSHRFIAPKLHNIKIRIAYQTNQYRGIRIELIISFDSLTPAPHWSHVEQVLASNHINHWKRSGYHFLRQEVEVSWAPSPIKVSRAKSRHKVHTAYCTDAPVTHRWMNGNPKRKIKIRKPFSSGATITECKHVCKSQIGIVVEPSVVECLRGVLVDTFPSFMCATSA